TLSPLSNLSAWLIFQSTDIDTGRTNSNNENSDNPANFSDNNNCDLDKEYKPIARPKKQKEVGEEGAKVDKEKQKEVGKEEAEVDKKKQKDVGEEGAQTDKGKQKEIVEEVTSRVSSHQEFNISASDINYQDPNIDDIKIIKTLTNTEIFLQCLLEQEEPEDQEKESEDN
ncbi:10022_t:CDS:2, partial [Racocetra persica]